MTDALTGPARAATNAAPPIGDAAYLRYCAELARSLTERWPHIAEANRRDLAAASAAGMPPTLLTRLALTEEHLDRMIALTGRVGQELETLGAVPVEADGAARSVRRVPRPLGVVMMIYEARPTVTIDGALLPVCAGNAVLLRGGKENRATNAALGAAARAALTAAGLPADLVTVLDDPDRSQLRALLKRPDRIDVLIPRGSPSLIDYCRTSAIPMIASGGGVNHLYVDRSADLELAARVTLDSKLPEPAGCTSVEFVLLERSIADGYLQALAQELKNRQEELTVRLDPGLAAPAAGAGLNITELQPHDAGREFLDPVIAVKAVDDAEAALDHIRAHGSKHTEGILARDAKVIDGFCRRVDAAMVVVNGSLRLHDGPTLGLGTELSIATGRLHVRGPVTLGSLVSHGYVVDGGGALRG